MSDVVDTTGIKVDDPSPAEGGLWPGHEDYCGADSGYFCTAPPGHKGPHVAEGMDRVEAVWDQ